MTFRYKGTNWEGRRWECPPSVVSFGDQLTVEYPVRLNTVADGTVASEKHDQTSPNSDHRPHPFEGPGVVRALDAGVSKEQGNVITEALRVSRDTRIKYVIWDGRRFSQSGGWVWSPYTGANPHSSHFHISTVTAADDIAGPWSLGGEDDDMPLSDEDIAKVADAVAEKVWYWPIPDEDDNTGTRGASHALRQAWGYSKEAATRPLPPGGGLSEADVKAIINGSAVVAPE